jgi:hypothetical protein
MPNQFFRSALGLAQGLCWALFTFSGMELLAQLPDLTVDRPRLQSSISIDTRTFATDSCTVVEGCALPGTRKLLLFDTGFINISSNDLVIGDPAQRPDIFHFSPCHGHYHMDGVAGYELIDAAGTTVLTGRKQGFCLRDNEAAVAGAGPAKYTCDYQGLSAGWEDIYDKSLDCQWLDISDIVAGSYILRVVCNPDAMFQESNYENNVVDVSITISVTNKPPPKPPTCDKDWWKKHCKKPHTWKDLKDKWGEKWWKKCKIHKCDCENNGHHDGKGNDDDDDDDDDQGGGKGDDDDDDGDGGDHDGQNGDNGKHKGKGKDCCDHGKHKGKGKGKGHRS